MWSFNNRDLRTETSEGWKSKTELSAGLVSPSSGLRMASSAGARAAWQLFPRSGDPRVVLSAVRGLVHTDKRVAPEGTGLSLWGRLVQATRTRKTFGDKMENGFSSHATMEWRCSRAATLGPTQVTL